MADTVWTDVATNDAIFDQAGAYTVTLAASRTAGTAAFSNGNVTLAGAGLTLTAGTVNVGSGTLNSVEGALFKSGTTILNVDGAFNYGSGSASGRFVTLTGAGTVNAGSLRVAGNTNFAGTFADFSPTVVAGINTNGFAGITTTFSGNLAGASGDFLYSSTNTLRLNGTAVLDANTKAYLRLEGGTTATTGAVAELNSGNLVRVYAASTGSGGANLANYSGYSAIGSDRTVTYVTAPGGSTAASLTWGTSGFNPSVLILANGNATAKLSLVNDLSLVNTARTVQVADGTADVDSELSGIISSTGTTGGLIKTGAGTLLLSNSNTFTGNVTIGAGAGFVRVNNGQALGTDATVKTVALAGGGTGGIQLTGGVTVNNKTLTLGGRTVGPTFAGLINLSGNNTWNGNIAFVASGGGYVARSDAGTLTLGGNIFNSVGDASSSRGLVLLGAGNYAITGLIRNSATVAANITNLNVGNGAQANFSGTATVSNANTYTGGTTITSGRLITANASALGAGSVIVGSTTPTIATLTIGDGTNNTLGGLSGLTVNSASTLEFAANTATPEIMLASGIFSLTNAVLNLNNQFNAVGSYTLIDGVDGANLASGTTFQNVNAAAYNYTFGIVGNDGVLTVKAVPEPATIGAIGLGALTLLRRRRRA